MKTYLVIATSDEEHDCGDSPKRSWRWQLRIGFSGFYFYYLLQCQIKFNDEENPKWIDRGRFYELNFRPFYWKWKYSEDVYNGMYRMFSFGPFHLNWLD